MTVNLFYLCDFFVDLNGLGRAELWAGNATDLSAGLKHWRNKYIKKKENMMNYF